MEFNGGRWGWPFVNAEAETARLREVVLDGWKVTRLMGLLRVEPSRSIELESSFLASLVRKKRVVGKNFDCIMSEVPELQGYFEAREVRTRCFGMIIESTSFHAAGCQYLDILMAATRPWVSRVPVVPGLGKILTDELEFDAFAFPQSLDPTFVPEPAIHFDGNVDVNALHSLTRSIPKGTIFID